MNFERVSGEKVHKVVDNSWKTFFARDDFRSPGIRVVTGAPGLAGYRGIYLLRIGEGCTIGVPDEIASVVGRRARGLSPDEVFTREAAAALAGDLAELVLGPSWHGYTDEAGSVKSGPCDARRITEAEAEPLRAAVAEAEWSEGGFGHDFPDVSYGCFEGAELVAAGNMTDFDAKPADVGLVTHPDARGRGYGKRLAGAMMADAFASGIPVLRYRALFTNVASLSVARKLGFVGDGANIAVRLTA